MFCMCGHTCHLRIPGRELIPPRMSEDIWPRAAGPLRLSRVLYVAAPEQYHRARLLGLGAVSCQTDWAGHPDPPSQRFPATD